MKYIRVNTASPNYYYISFGEFEAWVLKYRYMASTIGGDDFWHGFLTAKLDELTREELEKWNDEEKSVIMRETNLPKCGVYAYNSLFEKPSTWTFYDDMIPQWREEWLELLRATKQKVTPAAKNFFPS